MLTACDVLAPCALGGVIGAAEAERLRTAIVCGAANNVLTAPEVAEVLHERGVLYAPDFIANAGGLISVYGELRGLNHARALELARGIETTMESVIELSAERNAPPLEAAQALALGRLNAEAVGAASY